MVRYDGADRPSPLPFSEPNMTKENRGVSYYKGIIAAVALGLVVVALVSVAQPGALGRVELEFNEDAQKAMSLEISKKKYDQAKSQVKSLSEEFSNLQAQLQRQVHVLQNARSDLVSQIAGAEGVSPAELPAAPAAATNTQAPIVSDRLASLRKAAALVARADPAVDDEDEDAASAAEHALHYTQQVASRVGDLADQSEVQAERIVDAARLTQEAKEAMQSALEQSSRIVDYNTHAAQAVAQDSGFVTTASQTIAGYMKDIFHDARAVHQAATFAVKHMNNDVDAADHAVAEIEADAKEAYDVLEHIHKADDAAVQFATKARASAITASDAAEGAIRSERASMAAGVRSVAAAHSSEAAAHAAAQYAAAARFSPPHHHRLPPPLFAQPEPDVPGVDVPADADAALVRAKDLVDSVVVLMQQLTNGLNAAAGDCSKVEGILSYYQLTMARYHAAGQQVARLLSDEDMGLVQQYAEVEVHPFAPELQDAVLAASSSCGIPVTSFIPEVNYSAKDTAELPATGASSTLAQDSGANEEAAAKKAMVSALKADVKARAAAKVAANKAAK